jgi:hypothetical protein
MITLGRLDSFFGLYYDTAHKNTFVYVSELERVYNMTEDKKFIQGSSGLLKKYLSPRKSKRIIKLKL